MPVLAEPEMHQIEPAVTAMPGDDPRVLIAGPEQISTRHRHEMQVPIRQIGLPQDRCELGGVAVCVAVRRLALIDLEYVNSAPGEIHLDQAFEHFPRRASAAQRDAECAMP